MPSIRGSLEYLQPLVDVSVSASAGPSQRRHACRALIDTGATRTCVSARLIDQLELELRGKLLVQSARTTPERRRAYAFVLGLFYHPASDMPESRSLYLLQREFIGPAFQDNGNFDVLIGMDLLCLGRLVIDRSEFSFSFDAI